MKKIIVILILISLFILSSCTLFFNDIDNSSDINISVNPTDENEKNDFSNLSYCAFGDSITYGANYLDSYRQMENPYPKLVYETLGLKSYTNQAVSGGTLCSNDLGRVCITDIILSCNTNYDVISVMLGVNDFSVGLPLGTIDDDTTSTIYGCLNLIANKFNAEYKDSFCFFITPYKCKNGTKVNSSNYVLEDIRDAIIQVCMLNDLPYLDLYTNGKFENVMFDDNCDGLHPNQDFITDFTAPMISQYIIDYYK